MECIGENVDDDARRRKKMKEMKKLMIEFLCLF